ncbi:MAG: hypothetical protein KAJ01_03300, partial [Candidatus Hydrogenedentes bacterium]|nr:hypothetical protein [Candidatus Hydrogenedentota bacterium]
MTKLIVLFLACCSVVGAQSTDVTIQGDVVFAPFVSRLKATKRESSIVLNWRDSPDIQGTNRVYRHTAEITEKNIEQSMQLARVPHGEKSYIDYPPDTQSYYYAVILESPEGESYNIFIPFRNKTIVPVKIKFIGAPELLAAKITDIRAEGSTEGIKISFVSDKSSRDLMLYRSDSPLENLSDLLNTVSWVLIEGTTKYGDMPPAGTGYYYAVLDAELVKAGKVSLVPGENSTQFPVQVPLEKAEKVKTPESEPSTRIMPLPYLILSKEVKTGDELKSSIHLPRRVELNPTTSKAVGAILTDAPQLKERQMKVALLDMDQIENPTGEEYVLKAILHEHLLSGSYSQAETELVDFLSVRRKRQIEVRAHFYLAQSYYFQRQYRKALTEFLMTQDEYYKEVRHWVDA